MDFVICLAGTIASGKTTVGRALADAWPNSSVLSFGDVVRGFAEAEGLPLDRATLQRVGLRLISDGWKDFVGKLLNGTPRDAEKLIVDGIRHVEAVDELRRRFPTASVQLVYLDAGEVTLFQRLARRGESSDALAHLVENNLQHVALAADMKIDSSQPISDVVSRIIERCSGSSIRGDRTE